MAWDKDEYLTRLEKNLALSINNSEMFQQKYYEVATELRDLKVKYAALNQDRFQTFGKEVLEWFRDFENWSCNTFGTFGNPQGPIAHLKKEIEELEKAPHDPSEYVDIFMLLLEAFRFAGFGGILTFLQQARIKLEENKTRVYGPPGPDGVREHIRGENHDRSGSN